MKIMTPPTGSETVKGVVTASTVTTHLRENRIEYALLAVLLHLLEVTNYAFDKASGMC